MTPVTFAIPCTFLLVALVIMGITKGNVNSTRNKLYRLFVGASIFQTTAEFIIFWILKEYELSELAITILYKIEWSSALLIYLSFFLYIVAYVNDDKYSVKEIFSLGISRFILILDGFLTIIYLFLPFEIYLPTGELSFLPGPAAFAIWLYTLINIFSVTIYATVKKKNMRFSLYVLIYAIIQISIALVQFYIRTISFYPLGVTIFAFILFLAYENPDLYVVSNLQKINKDITKVKSTKSTFISNVAEEIKSPSTTIANISAKLLTEDVKNKELVSNDLSRIMETGKKLLDSVNNILDISKIESGGEEQVVEEYSIDDIINGTSNYIIPKAQEKGIEYGVEMGSNVPNKLEGDQAKLIQILNNVLANAVKYTKVGKVALMISCSIDKDIATLHFVISDSGVGIKEEDYDKVFSSGENAEENKESSGLGLYVTRKYVELMNGRIWFESIPLVGTTFYIDIPQKIIEHELQGSKSQQNIDNLKTIDCINKKALIVDDDLLNAEVAENFLRPYHFNIKTINNGRETIKKIKQGDEFDIIFVDIMMPGMDGIELMKALKKLAKFYKIPPIVALTANAIEGTREKYLKEGFEDYLSKPLDSKALNAIINKFITPEVKSDNYDITEIDGNANNESKVQELIDDKSRMVEYDIDDPFAFDDMLSTGAEIISEMDGDMPDEATITIQVDDKQ